MLNAINIEIWGFEPTGEIEPVIPEIIISDGISDLLDNCDVVVVTTNHVSFRKIPDLIESKHTKSPLVLIDMWRIIDSSRLPKNVVYRSWG
jgi:UDP-N-acetyl-D-mannosaminuronate dehydrogenase